MSRSILITGAGGFIGSALANFYHQKKDVKLFCTSRRQSTGISKLDLTVKEQVLTFLRKNRPKVIFHMAGGRSASVKEMMFDNVAGTMNLLASVEKIKGYRPRIIVAGSAAEYKPVKAKKLITENVPIEPADDYGTIKSIQTNIALTYSLYGVDVMVARFFNILGPQTPEAMAPGRFAKEIVRREKKKSLPPIMVGSLKSFRDFLDVRDVCAALDVLSQKGIAGQEYNICSQHPVTMRELLKGMIANSRNLAITFVEQRNESSGAAWAVGSNVKFRKISGWKPLYSLNESLKATLDSYRH